MTMLRVYAAWAEGMAETDVATINQAMTNRPAAMVRMAAAPATSFASEPVDLPLALTGAAPSPSVQRDLSGGEREGFEPRQGLSRSVTY
jgi:hypothetical protein